HPQPSTMARRDAIIADEKAFLLIARNAERWQGQVLLPMAWSTGQGVVPGTLHPALRRHEAEALPVLIDRLLLRATASQQDHQHEHRRPRPATHPSIAPCTSHDGSPSKIAGIHDFAPISCGESLEGLEAEGGSDRVDRSVSEEEHGDSRVRREKIFG